MCIAPKKEEIIYFPRSGQVNKIGSKLQDLLWKVIKTEWPLRSMFILIIYLYLARLGLAAKSRRGGMSRKYFYF